MAKELPIYLLICRAGVFDCSCQLQGAKKKIMHWQDICSKMRFGGKRVGKSIKVKK